MGTIKDFADMIGRGVAKTADYERGYEDGVKEVGRRMKGVKVDRTDLNGTQDYKEIDEDNTGNNGPLPAIQPSLVVRKLEFMRKYSLLDIEWKKALEDAETLIMMRYEK